MKTKNKTIQDLREDYKHGSLEIKDIDKNPFLQFDQWFQEALNSEVLEPNAMTLATCSAKGRPSARVVLLKGFDNQGFIFYTNYTSKKGKELNETPFAALVFNWLELQRQVRIEGRVEKLSEEASTTYFQRRPKGSQIGAWASPQSQVIVDRSILQNNVTNLQVKYAKNKVLPKPKHWGGYLIIPDRIEFWQGRSSRLHDRLNYFLDKKGTWQIERLAP